MKKNRALGVLAVCAAALGCWQAGTAPVDVVESVELRTYVVPADYRDQMRSLLRSALESDENRIGRVSNGPGKGQLLVVAPPRIQAGVQQIIKEGYEAPPPAVPMTLTYWLLVGRPVDLDSGARPWSVVGGRGLPQIEPVLRQITSAQGPTEFALLEQLQLTSMSQEAARTRGTFARISQRATRSGDHVVSNVEILLDENHFESRVMLQPGQFLVLGQSGFAGSRGNAFADVRNGDMLTLYYVVAADLES